MSLPHVRGIWVPRLGSEAGAGPGSLSHGPWSSLATEGSCSLPALAQALQTHSPVLRPQRLLPCAVFASNRPRRPEPALLCALSQPGSTAGVWGRAASLGSQSCHQSGLRLGQRLGSVSLPAVPKWGGRGPREGLGAFPTHPGRSRHRRAPARPGKDGPGEGPPARLCGDRAARGSGHGHPPTPGASRARPPRSSAPRAHLPRAPAPPPPE